MGSTQWAAGQQSSPIRWEWPLYQTAARRKSVALSAKSLLSPCSSVPASNSIHAASARRCRRVSAIPPSAREPSSCRTAAIASPACASASAAVSTVPAGSLPCSQARQARRAASAASAAWISNCSGSAAPGSSRGPRSIFIGREKHAAFRRTIIREHPIEIDPLLREQGVSGRKARSSAALMAYAGPCMQLCIQNGASHPHRRACRPSFLVQMLPVPVLATGKAA